MVSIAKTGSLLLGSLLMAGHANAETLYNLHKSNVQTMNAKNFDKQVIKNREKGISIVQFYKDDGKSICSSYRFNQKWHW